MVVVHSAGAKYKRHASLILPLFRRGKIWTNFDLIVDCTDRFFLDRWRSLDASVLHRDLVQQCQRLFLAIFGYVAFDYDLEALQDFIQIFTTILYIPRWMGQIYLTDVQFEISSGFSDHSNGSPTNYGTGTKRNSCFH